jgi:cardiolipin synthase
LLKKLAWAPLLIMAAAVFSACGTVSDARATIQARLLYRKYPTITGPGGPLTPKQAQLLLERITSHQQTPTDLLGRHLALEQALAGAPLVLGNKVTLLKNAKATYDAMLTAIRGAKSSINLEMYIFSSGPIGQTFADALIERQRHGVQVNVSYDSVGSFGTPDSFFDRMRKSGIAVLEYRPIDPFKTKHGWSLGHRDHRKMLVVDGRIAFTGGINISEVYASGLSSRGGNSPQASWRDTDVEIEGPAVAEFQKIFITQWNYQEGQLLAVRDYFPKLEARGNQIVRVIASVPERFSLIYVTLISAIVSSQTNIYITDAYFAPDHQILRVLKNAARRGVDVRLLVPSQTDEPLVVSAARSHYASLLEAGVKIYEWQGEMLHAKTATMDGVWSTVGTSNLDWWSIARDNELNAIVLSHSFGADMDSMFMSDLENSREIELDQWRHRGLMERLDETAASLIEPLL